MAGKSVVGPKGQITIPKDLRERYHLLRGEEVVLVGQEDGVLVKHSPSSLRGRLKGKITTEGIEDEVREFRREWKVPGK